MMDQVTFYLDVPLVSREGEQPFVTTSTPRAFLWVLHQMSEDDIILRDGETLVLIGYRGTHQTGWALLKKRGREYDVPIDNNLLAANALSVPYAQAKTK
jgi:hypothetical protein